MKIEELLRSDANITPNMRIWSSCEHVGTCGESVNLFLSLLLLNTDKFCVRPHLYSILCFRRNKHIPTIQSFQLCARSLLMLIVVFAYRLLSSE